MACQARWRTRKTSRSQGLPARARPEAAAASAPEGRPVQPPRARWPGLFAAVGAIAHAARGGRELAGRRRSSVRQDRDAGRLRPRAGSQGSRRWRPSIVCVSPAPPLPSQY